MKPPFWNVSTALTIFKDFGLDAVVVMEAASTLWVRVNYEEYQFTRESLEGPVWVNHKGDGPGFVPLGLEGAHYRQTQAPSPGNGFRSLPMAVVSLCELIEFC